MNTEQVDREGRIRLLRCILADQPRLSGAACIGHHELFDPIRGNALDSSGYPVNHHCPDATTTTVEAA